MTPLSLAVLFALRRESMFFLPLLTDVRRVSLAPCPAWVGHSAGARILVLEGGVGRRRTRQVLEWLAQGPVIEGANFHPRHVVSAGFGGALEPGLEIADVVLAAEVVDEEGATWPVGGAPLPWPGRRLLTVSRLVGDPGEKQALGRRFQAQAVDMESAEVAAFCKERNLPLICLRAISDDVRARLSPALVEILSAGRVSCGKLAWLLVCRPWLIFSLLRLGRDTRRAGRKLAGALEECLRFLTAGEARS